MPTNPRATSVAPAILSPATSTSITPSSKWLPVTTTNLPSSEVLWGAVSVARIALRPLYVTDSIFELTGLRPLTESSVKAIDVVCALQPATLNKTPTPTLSVLYLSSPISETLQFALLTQVLSVLH